MMTDAPPRPSSRHDPAGSAQRRRSWPIIASIIVGAAILAMIGLGFWQLQRKLEKEALIALFERNMAMTESVAYPELPPVDPAFFYRKSSVVCLDVVRYAPRGGTDRDGQRGIRMLAECRTGADGPGALVDIGTSDDFTLPEWDGGTVAGRIVPGPEQPTLIARMTGKAAPARPVLVADEPAAGLRPSAVPSAADTPNNHFAYAMQWFFFAAGAAVIFLLAARRRLRA